MLVALGKKDSQMHEYKLQQLLFCELKLIILYSAVA